MEKTGTTSLQEFLYENIELLSANGVYLSTRLGGINNRKLSGFSAEKDGGYWATRGISNLKQKNDHFRGFRKDFKNHVNKAKTTHHTMVVTCENLWRCVREDAELEKLKTLFEGLFDSITIIGYFRRPDDHFRSMYSTYVRTSGKLGFEEYCRTQKKTELDRVYDFSQGAKAWEKHFGKDNLLFRAFDRSALVNGDVRSDFINLFWPELSERLIFSKKLSNEKQSVAVRNAMLCINRAFPRYDNNGVSSVNEYLKEVAMKYQFNNKTKETLSSGLGVELSLNNEYAQSLREFFSSYLTTIDATAILSDLSSGSSPDEINMNELRDLFVLLLNSLNKHLNNE